MEELARVSKAEYNLRAEVHLERDWRHRLEREASRNKEAVHRLFARHHLGATQHKGETLRSGHATAQSAFSERHSLQPRRSAQPRSPMLSISRAGSVRYTIRALDLEPAA